MANPQTGLGSSALAYLKKNAKFAYGSGLLGGMFVASDLKGILDADNKFKALLKTFKDFLIIRIAMAGIFTAIAAAVKGLVRETGSLEAALKKLTQIQIFSRQLSGLVGGLQVAKRRIAELSELSNRGPFKFEEIVEANRSLEIFTRGAYSSVEATKSVGDVAIATGNSIEDTARVVGNFYDNLRSGRPISEATEQMRQMGLISQSTADHLNKMSENGQNVSTVFNELQRSLSLTATGAEGYKNELSTIVAEHSKAAQVLKEKFGAPFTESEAENIKNTTAAYQAITPTIATVAKSLALVYNGFSTVKTALIKTVAESRLAQNVFKGLVFTIEALTVAGVAFGTLAATQLTRAILGWSVAIQGLSGWAAIAARSIQGLALVGTWALVAGAILGVAGAVYTLSQHNKKAEQDARDWIKSHQDATAALAAEIASVKTLTEKNEALAKSIRRIIDLEKERKDIINKTPPAEPSKQLEQLPPGNIKRLVGLATAKRQEELNKQRVSQVDKDLEQTKQLNKELQRINPAHEKLIDAEAERRMLIEQQSKGAESRSLDIRKGIEAEAAVTEQRSKYDEDITNKQEQLKSKREEIANIQSPKTREFEEFKFNKLRPGVERDITNLLAKQQKEGLKAPPTSAVFLETKVQQLLNARKADAIEARIKQLPPGEARDQFGIEAERARALAGGVKYTSAALTKAEIEASIARKREERIPNPEEERAARVRKFEVETEISAHQARRRGDVRGAQAQEDILAFTQHFEEMLPLLGKQKASSVALAETQDEIIQQYQGAQQVVSSMQAVGGGGNLSGVDPMLQSARRREELQNKMVELLGILAGQEPQQVTTPTFQP